jgi:hypothetical protein
LFKFPPIQFGGGAPLQLTIFIPVEQGLQFLGDTIKQDFEGGWAQCVAEMIACQKLNQNDHLTVYGVVSTGILWDFGLSVCRM